MKQATFKKDEEATESSGGAGSRKGYDHWAMSIFLSMWEGMTDGTFPREGGIYGAVFSQGGRNPPSLGTVRSEAGGLRFRAEKRAMADYYFSGAVVHCRNQVTRGPLFVSVMERGKVTQIECGVRGQKLESGRR